MPGIFHSAIFQKDSFLLAAINNISGTNKFHVNQVPHHRGLKLPNPRVERKSRRKNAFVGPPFVGPKNIRFRHGFKRI